MERQAVPDGIYPAASTVHANVSIGVFTEYGILYGSDFDSAEFRIIPRNSVFFFVYGISYFKKGRNMVRDTERRRQRERDRWERIRGEETKGKRQRERDR